MTNPRTSALDPCWRGKGDPSPFTPGLPPVVPRARSLPSLFEVMTCCTRCDLALGRTQVVTGSGPASARLMLLGEAPGAQEDRAGKPFVGAAGRLLENLFEESGIAREEVFITNVVACRPPANRTPRVREVEAHAPWLEEQLRLVRPALIATLGRVALQFFLPKAKVTELQGELQVVRRGDEEWRLLPLVHPAAALRNRELLPALTKHFRTLGRLLAEGAGRA